ncbi:50S ribosomal protein L3 [Bacteroidetes/Chlorobi group bacterium ChocPot_Mid]|jgi:large subunit ribosomal protein L3|nr:MAG: 50S ribosomal protein L3 [Bacteroidetes/Chlorobi group bacterium ChocPot_Mid]
MNAAILGKKIGMTSIYTETGEQIPCTVFEAGPCPVVIVRTKENDGYSAVQLGYEELPERKLNKPMKGHFSKAGVKPTRHLKEFRDLNNQVNVGDVLTVEQFKAGDKLRISGTSIGRGFQGVVKRHHFGGVGMTTHGQSDRQRHPGSVGASSYPSRVIKGLRMAGRMGGKRATVRNLKVIEVIPEQNLLLVKGSVPGPKNAIVEIIKQK